MQDTQSLVKIIAKCLERLTKISSIVYSPNPRSVPLEAADMYGLVPRSYTYFQSPQCLKRDRLYYETKHTSPKHPFHALIAAIYLSKYAGIREFRVEKAGSRFTSLFALDFFTFPDKLDQKACQYFFENLTKLELNFSAPYTQYNYRASNADYLEEIMRFGNLARLLRSTGHLQHLSLEFDLWYDITDFIGCILGGVQSVFGALGLDAPWQNLQSLRLAFVRAREEDYTRFFYRHGKTLRTVSFEECRVRDGLWANIVDIVVSSTRISSFHLYSVSDGSALLPARKDPGKPEIMNFEGRLLIHPGGERVFVCIRNLY